MEPFDAVVTLGGWCRVTYQARTFFGYKDAYPFDWVVCPTPSLFAMLTTDFSNLLEEHSLLLRKDGDGVTCLQYGIQHKHDFLRDDNHQTLRNITDQIERVQSKFAYRKRNFDNLISKERLLFIRYDDISTFRQHDEDYTHAGVRATEADGRALHAHLSSVFSKSDVTLLCVDFDAPTQTSAGIIFDRVADYNDHESWDYRGSTRGWNELFSRHGLHLRMAGDTAMRAYGADVSAEIDVPAGYW